jgi:hypothetical protein
MLHRITQKEFKMAKYLVEVTQPITHTIEVEADSNEEAVDKATAKAERQYAGNWEGDSIHIEHEDGQWDYIASIETTWSQGY